MKSIDDSTGLHPKQMINSNIHNFAPETIAQNNSVIKKGISRKTLQLEDSNKSQTVTNDFFEKLCIPVCIINEEKGQFKYSKVNAHFADLLDKQISEITGFNIDSVLAATEVKELKSALLKSKYNKFSYYIFKKNTHSNKSYICSIKQFEIIKKCNSYACSFAESTSLTNYIEDLKKEKILRNTYLDIAGVMILVLDITGKVKYINKKGCEMLGYSVNEITGRNWFNNFIPRNDSKTIRQRFKKLLSGKKPEEFYENEVATKTNGNRLIFWHTSNLFDENGKCYGIVSSGEDITEHKRIQTELTNQSRNADFMYKLSRIISNSQDTTDLIGRSSKLLSAYPGIISGSISVFDKEQKSNFSKTCYLGKHIKAIDYIFEREKNNYLKAIPSGAYEDLTNLTFSVYGKSRHVQSYTIGMFIQKEPQGLITIIGSGITPFSLKFYEHAAIELSRGIKKKKVDLKQQQVERNFSAIFNTAPDCMVITSLEGSVILEVNSGFSEMTGFSREAVIGKSVFEINSWANPKERLKLTSLLKKDKKVSGFNTKLIRTDGSTFDALFSAAYIDFNGKKCMLTIAKDISDRVKIEKENIETRELLERITAATPAFISLYNVKKDLILFTNKSLLMQLGYTKDTIAKIQTLSPAQRDDFYHKDDVELVKSLDKKVLGLNQGDILKQDYRIKDSSGNYRWFQHSVTIFQKESKYTPLLTINVFDDITERKTAEEQFRKNKEEIEFLYQAGNILSGTLDIYQIYDRMHSLVQKIANINELIVSSYDEETKLIQYKYLRSTETDHRIDVTNIPPIPLAPEGFGIVSKVIRSGSSMLFNNYSDSFAKAKTVYVINDEGKLTDQESSEFEPKSAMFIPISLKKKILGVAQFYSLKENAFNEEQVRLLELMMNQVALATHNANLYEAAQNEITVRKRAEAELNESRENLVKLAESVPDVIYRYSYITEKYEFISPVIIKMIGYPLENIVNDPCAFFRTVIHPDDWVNVKRSLDEVKEEGPTEIPVNLEYRMFRKDGSMLWVRDIKKIEWLNGKPIASVGAISDITNARKTEEERRLRDEQIIKNQSALLELSRLKNINFEDTIRSINEISARSAKIDRVSVWLINNDGDLESTDMFTLWDKAHRKGNTMQKILHTGFFEMLRSEIKYTGKSSNSEEFMKNYLKEYLKPFKSSQILISRVRLHGEVVGMIVFESQNKEKIEWTPEEFDFSVSAAGYVTIALESQEHIDAEIKIKRSLNDKELLLREIHHRVKNNLQVISSLLYLQSRKCTDPIVIDELLESQRRIKSMVLIHEKLYRSEDLSNIDYKQYITALTTSLFRSYRLDMSRITLKTEIDDIKLNTDSAIQCGLIINELVSNSIKHAFPDERSGEIKISFSNSGDNTFTLSISDNGVGIPKDFDIESSETLGMQLVKTLVDQMGGMLEIQNSNGSSFTIIFTIKNKY